MKGLAAISISLHANQNKFQKFILSSKSYVSAVFLWAKLLILCSSCLFMSQATFSWANQVFWSLIWPLPEERPYFSYVFTYILLSKWIPLGLIFFWWSNANMDLALLLTINVSFLWTACSIFFSFSFKARPTIIPLPPPYALPPPHHLNVPQMAWLILPRAFLSHVALPRPFPSQLEATALMCHQYYAMVLVSITCVAL